MLLFKARNLFFSAYDLSNQADITITENATFDIENDFFNGFNLDGTGYSGGDIIADNFNVTVGNDFFNLFNATISADNFNVTAGDDFYNGNMISMLQQGGINCNSTINADNFNCHSSCINRCTCSIKKAIPCCNIEVIRINS